MRLSKTIISPLNPWPFKTPVPPKKKKVSKKKFLATLPKAPF